MISDPQIKSPSGHQDGETIPVRKTFVPPSGKGSPEWYTPPHIIEAARKVLGTIDLDPASCEFANRVVKATKFYDKEADALSQPPWTGNVWMNPPYGRGAVSAFCGRLVHDYKSGHIRAAVVLINADNKTKHFQLMADNCSAWCNLAKETKFYSPDGAKGGGGIWGQAVFFFGRKPALFDRHFRQFGVVSVPYRLRR